MGGVMSFALAENLSARSLEQRQKVWGKQARLFAVGARASQLITAVAMSTGQMEGLTLWLAGSGIVFGLGAFAIPWGRYRIPQKRKTHQAADQRMALLHALPVVARSRYLRLMIPVKQACGLLQLTVDPTRGAGAPRRLEHLLWLYLRLLTAGHQLAVASRGVELDQLEEEGQTIQQLLLSGGDGTPAIRSRRAALELIEQRLATYTANQKRMEEIECDLRRIEHHCALFLEQAAHAGSMGEVSFLIDLDLPAGTSLELFSEASQQMLQDSSHYYLAAS